ncbi:hypothetical protein SELMODRAFT_431801 [Selaginella moellendorffii]|uniref:Helicase C-terminal domain-containing protein n=1 Tax=Selaginella moellendorffii TaxID=88036 RepID=D8TDU8_SELML|nr:hypothetical protein SELMODRAFT_431801 [Selaginella moellendorffii]
MEEETNDAGVVYKAECDVESGSMRADLMKHQKKALAWMLACVTKGGILTDDQGLGWAKDQWHIDKIKGGTLIVCPMSVLGQWEREITIKEVPFKANVVTTDDCGVDYSQIASLKKRLEKSRHLPFGPLAKVAWHRVVLDEAQSIRKAYTQVSLSCRDLSATYRWGLSGTPLQNNIKDLFAFFRFLRISPHKSHADFKLHYEQFEKTGNSATLKTALKCIVLRRSKTSLIDGQPVLSLPPRLYNNRIDEYSNEGTLQKNRFKILSMLLRLRQMCDHPALLKSEDLFQGDNLDNDDEDQKQMRQALKKLQLEAQEKQHDFERDDSLGEKSLVFSQWTSMLDLIELELECSGIKFARIDGSMNMTKREAAIGRFNKDPEVMVLLLSLRAAGCGLNLVAASRVLLIDMWWNGRPSN